MEVEDHPPGGLIRQARVDRRRRCRDLVMGNGVGEPCWGDPKQNCNTLPLSAMEERQRR
jgi:hypothetical protein